MKSSQNKQKGFFAISLKPNATDLLVGAALRLFAANFSLRPSLRKYLKSADGWINFAVGICTEDKSVAYTLTFKQGRVSVKRGVQPTASAVMIYRDEIVIKEMVNLTPNEVLLLLLNSKMRIQGNMSVMSLFNFYLSLILSKQYKKMMLERREADRSHATIIPTSTAPGAEHNRANERRLKERLTGESCDQVQYLDDPYLAQYSLQDFPRIQQFLEIYFSQLPEVCSERPRLLTQWFKQHGFETQSNGIPWNPVLRQAHALKFLMSSKQPLIRKNDLIAGTTTRKEIGVVLYPDAHACLLWGELLTLPDRTLNPYSIDPKERDLLHRDVLPFWINRNFKEWVRERYSDPLCQRLDERFAVYFNWKTVALSHTILDFPKLLTLGTQGIIQEIEHKIASFKVDQTKQVDTLNAMKICLEGIEDYSLNLARKVQLEASKEKNLQRKVELERIVEVCRKVPMRPAATLDEALQTIWLGWITLHMENTNAGLSFGRVDQWLQPYFSADLEKLQTEEEKQTYIKQTIERVACFFMRCTDHLPTVPDIGNYLFGGSSSTQSITLGGVTKDGESAVNDMTFILLKVTEMLKLRDPNINARYHSGKNSEIYLQRLCEVNLITTATPSIHGDENVMRSLEGKGYSIEEIRDWSAVGCVEPAISGKHMGHTGSIMFNMVAALEMALNNGKHPLMNWQVGPATGCVEKKAFKSFDSFYTAFTRQLEFLVAHSVEYNNLLAEAHSVIRPTPLLSSMMDGCIDQAKDATVAGAKYNTSGVACIGLSDIVDSLMVIKKLVFDDKKTSMSELMNALQHDFKDCERLHALIMNKVPKFGSADAAALAMANRVTKTVHECFASKTNFRGGAYTTGFWSMSNHVAFGNLTGALPSGRKSGKAFTPGLTPSPQASKNLLDNIRDVGELNPKYMDNNVAFNVKYVPSSEDGHQQSVFNMSTYVKTYCQFGGMQMQMNVVSSEVLKDAMEHPENYRDLLVRISGYNAYFVTLNKEMQIELIERAQYSA